MTHVMVDTKLTCGVHLFSTHPLDNLSLLTLYASEFGKGDHRQTNCMDQSDTKTTFCKSSME